MKENLELMNERGISAPVVLGGAALTRRYVEDDLKSIYKGQLYYARDAFAGLHTMDRLVGGNGDHVALESLAKAASVGGNNGGEDVQDLEDLVGDDAKLGLRKPSKPRGASRIQGDTTHTTRSAVRQDVEVPQAPFFGSRVVEEIPLDDVFAFVNEVALFKGQWQ
jgi:5-methyltetrahydrofolate--homocysteine methyltransferase